MTRHLLHVAGALLALSALSTQAAEAMSRADQEAAKRQIDADYRDEKAACNRYTGNEQDVCEERAEGRRKVAHAELQFNVTGSPRDADRLATARVEADYEVADELCDAMNGAQARACEADAKAVRTRALADIKNRRSAAAP